MLKFPIFSFYILGKLRNRSKSKSVVNRRRTASKLRGNKSKSSMNKRRSVSRIQKISRKSKMLITRKKSRSILFPNKGLQLEEVKEVPKTKISELTTKTPKLILKITKSPIEINLPKKTAIPKLEIKSVEITKVDSVTKKIFDSEKILPLTKLEKKTTLLEVDLHKNQPKEEFSKAEEHIVATDTKFISNAKQIKNVEIKPKIDEKDSLISKTKTESSKDDTNNCAIDTDVFYSIFEENQKIPVYSKNSIQNNQKDNEKNDW